MQSMLEPVHYLLLFPPSSTLDARTNLNGIALLQIEIIMKNYSVFKKVGNVEKLRRFAKCCLAWV
jgi:hypothetical protein